MAGTGNGPPSSLASLAPWGAALSSGLGVLASFGLGGEAAAARKRAAMEQLRRDDTHRATTLGQGEAAAGASGVEVTSGSSLGTYLQQMTQEFRREHQWQSDQARTGAALEGEATGWNLASGLGGSFMRLGQDTNWKFGFGGKKQGEGG